MISVNITHSRSQLSPTLYWTIVFLCPTTSRSNHAQSQLFQHILALTSYLDSIYLSIETPKDGVLPQFRSLAQQAFFFTKHRRLTSCPSRFPSSPSMYQHHTTAPSADICNCMISPLHRFPSLFLSYHNKATSPKPYLTSTVMWADITTAGIHPSIPIFNLQALHPQSSTRSAYLRHSPS